ncbi:ubiquitin carboxyl-terminal hydrolase 1, putative [Plasmodium vinckei brucechwatti]|uniref:Ubiquitin carboxyl-terminal hydrolase 1, putative n=1 Tax=Plasmodium vinckei brucechwatti TaxID=119398 RepID=A0A6V7RTE6_PLAVN|nr:ubiquitin carboxyl-terminal hydrolase 1, putative [Plasmodium vinckei brucechwatti]
MDKKKKKHKKREISDPGDEINNCEKEKGNTQFDESYPFDNSEPNQINENHNVNGDEQTHVNIKNKNPSNSFEDDILEFLPPDVDNNSDIFHTNEVNKIEENNINHNEQNKKNRDPNSRPDPKGNDDNIVKNNENTNLLVTNENVNNHFENSDENSNKQLNKHENQDENNEQSNKSEDSDEHRSGRKKRSVKDNVYEDFIREYKNLQSLFSYNKTIMNGSFDPMPSISEDDNNDSDKNGNEHNQDMKTPFDENVNKSATSCNHTNPDYSATYHLNDDAAVISDANKTSEKAIEQAREQMEKKLDENNHQHFSNQLNYPTNNDAKENENKNLLSEKENENDKEKVVEAKNHDTNFDEGKEHMELKKEIKHKESENRENKQNKEKEISGVSSPENEEHIIWEKEKDIDEISKKKEDHYIQKKNTITLQPQEKNSSSNISVASIINDNFDDYNLYKKNNIAKMDIAQISNDLKKKTHDSIDNNEYKSSSPKNNRISTEIQKSKSELDNIKIKKIEKEMDDPNFYINILDENSKDNSKKGLYLNNSFYLSKRDNNNNNSKVKSAKYVEDVNRKIKKVNKHQVSSDEGSEIDEVSHKNYSKINKSFSEHHRKKDTKKKNNNTENTFDSKHLNDDNISLSYFTEDKKEDYDSIHETKETSHEYVNGKVKNHIRENKETNKYKNIDPTIVKNIKNITKHTDFNINNLDNQLCKLDSPIKHSKHHKETTKKKSRQTSSSVKKKHTKHSSKKNKRDEDANDSDIKEWESKFVEEDEEDDEEDNDPYLAIINEKKKRKESKHSKKKKIHMVNESLNNSISSVDDTQSGQEEDENDQAMQLGFFNFFDKRKNNEHIVNIQKEDNEFEREELNYKKKKKKKKEHHRKPNDILKDDVKFENNINSFFSSFWDSKNLKKNNKEDLYNLNNENNKDIYSVNKMEKKMNKPYLHISKEDNLNEQIDRLRREIAQNNILAEHDKHIDERKSDIRKLHHWEDGKKGKHNNKDDKKERDKLREKDKIKYREKMNYPNYEHNKNYAEDRHKYKKNHLENYDESYNPYSIEGYNNYSSSENEKRENELKRIYNKHDRKYMDGIVLNKNYDGSMNNSLKKKHHKNEDKENNYYLENNNDNSTVHNNSGYTTKGLGFFSSNFFHLKRLIEKKNVEANDSLKRENPLDKFYEKNENNSKNEKKKLSSFDIFQKLINNKGDTKYGKVDESYKRGSNNIAEIYHIPRGKGSMNEYTDHHETAQISDGYSEKIGHNDIDDYTNFQTYRRNPDDRDRRYYKDRREYHENEKHEKSSKHKKHSEYKWKKINKELINDHTDNIEDDEKSLKFRKNFNSNVTRTGSNESMVNEFGMDKLNQQLSDEEKNENNNLNKYEEKDDEIYENSESFLYSVDNFKIVKNILLSLELTNDNKINKIRKILFYSSSEEKKKIMDEILNTLYIYPQLYVSCIICLFYLFILDNDLFERKFSPDDLVYLFNDKIDFRYAEWFLKTYLFYKYKFSNSSNSDYEHKSYICDDESFDEPPKFKDTSIGKDKISKAEKMKNEKNKSEKNKSEKNGDINSLISEKDDTRGNSTLDGIEGNEKAKKKNKIKNMICDNFFESYNSSGDSMDNYVYCQNEKIEERNKNNESDKHPERKIDEICNKIETNKYVGYNECKMLLKICLTNENIQNIKMLSESKIRSLVISIWLNIRCSRPKKFFLKLIYNWINNKNDEFNKKKNLFNLLKAEKKHNKKITKACFNYFLKFLIKYKENCSNDIIYTLYLIDEHELKLYSKKFIEKNQININQFISIWNIMCILFWDTKKIHNFTFSKTNTNTNNYYYDFMLIFLKTFYEYIFSANSQIYQNVYFKKMSNISGVSTINFSNRSYNKLSSKASSTYAESQNKGNYNDESDDFNLFDVENIIKDFNFNDIVNVEVNSKNLMHSPRDHIHDSHGTHPSESMESENREEAEQSEHAKENTIGIKNMLKFIIQKSKKEKNMICCSDVNEIKLLVFLGICIKIVICRISNLLNAKACLEQFYYFINHKVLGLKIFRHSHIVLVYFIPFFKKYYFLWKFIEHEIDPEIIKLINAIINNLENLQNNKNINNIGTNPILYPYTRSNTSLPELDHFSFPSKDKNLNHIFNNFSNQCKPHDYKANFSHNISIENNNSKQNIFKHKQNNLSLDSDLTTPDLFNLKNNKKKKKNSDHFEDSHNKNQRHPHDYSEFNLNTNFHKNLINNINYLKPNSLFNTNENWDQGITYDDMFRDNDSNCENNHFDKGKNKICNVKEYITNLHFNNLPDYPTSLKNGDENKKSEDKKKKKKKLKNENQNSKEEHENGEEENNKTQQKEHNNISKLNEQNEDISFYNIPDNENVENKISKNNNNTRKYMHDDNFNEYKNGNKKGISNNYNHKEGSISFEEDKYRQNNRSNTPQNNGIKKFPTVCYEDDDNSNNMIDKKTQKNYINLELDREKKENIVSSKKLTNIETVKGLNNDDNYNNNETINNRRTIQNNVHTTNYNRNNNNMRPNEYEQFLRDKDKKKNLDILQRKGISLVNATASKNYEEINIVNNNIEKNKQVNSDKLIQKRPKYLMLPIDMIELKKMQKGKLRHPPVGLINLGNTCYLNSLLQALYNTVSFVVNLYIFNIDDSKELKQLNNKNISNDMSIKNKLFNPSNTNINNNTTSLLSKRFLYELKILFKLMTTTNKKYVSPDNILGILPQELNNRNQQDVTELFRYTFEQLGGSEKKFLRLIFSGVVIQKVQCQKCFYISKKEEIIHDLSFHVPARSNKKQSIQKFFDTYIQKEKIYGNNKYKCSKCDKRRNALKWNEIISPPCHLILILNRYNWSFSSNEKKKIKTHVKINKKIVVNNFDYRLYGGIIHSGVSASSGHYYFIGKKSEKGDNSKNEWYQMDDSVITKVSSKSINRISKDPSNDHTPYVLFYRCKQAPVSPSLYF